MAVDLSVVRPVPEVTLDLLTRNLRKLDTHSDIDYQDFSNALNRIK